MSQVSDCGRRCRRIGFTLLEFVAVMSVGTIVIFLMISVLVRTMGEVRHVREQTAQSLMLTDLSNRFREAMHRTTQFAVSENAGFFRRFNGDLMVIRTNANHITVTEFTPQSVGRSESYTIHGIDRFRLQTLSLHGRQFVSLVGASNVNNMGLRLRLLAALDANAIESAQADIASEYNLDKPDKVQGETK